MCLTLIRHCSITLCEREREKGEGKGGTEAEHNTLEGPGLFHIEPGTAPLPQSNVCDLTVNPWTWCMTNDQCVCRSWVGVCVGGCGCDCVRMPDVYVGLGVGGCDCVRKCVVHI